MPILQASLISQLLAVRDNQSELARLISGENILIAALANDLAKGGKALDFVVETLNSVRGMEEEDHAKIRQVKIALQKRIGMEEGERKILMMAVLTLISDVFGHWSYCKGQQQNRIQFLAEQTQIKDAFRSSIKA